MPNNSWLRVLGIVLLSLLVLSAVAFVAYRIGVQQGAGVINSDRPMPPTFFGEQGEWFGRRMHFMDGRGFYPMMRFGWHFFHPGFWLGLVALVLIVFLLVRGSSAQPASNAASRRSKRK